MPCKPYLLFILEDVCANLDCALNSYQIGTREVEEVDAICVHVGGEEVEKQGEETEGVARDRHALSFGMEIRAV